MTTSWSPATLKAGHIGLSVTDLDRSLPFYARVFGFETLAEGKEDTRRWAFLGRGDDLVVTLWQQSEDGFATGTAGLHHLSFQVDTLDELAATEAVLRELDTDFVHDGVTAHAEGAASGGIFFRDPDGIRLEVYVPTGAQGAPAPAGQEPTCGFF
ncbi:MULTISPECIES: VOC family protein [Streptomyces]|uniref:VOC family protein n=1 Tax=Streptomyces edwardsiae TaxID=3075527 RepID=A0ABU2PS12_9ACTN|nr:VOC family protein [Streptomyces sp. DSM 41636]MDT0393540.1 VOC family protein [Streptomyces sp. DSM 41636]